MSHFDCVPFNALNARESFNPCCLSNVKQEQTIFASIAWNALYILSL